MTKIMTAFVFVSFLVNVVEAATFKLHSREYRENNRGEIIEVDATVLNSKGEKVREAAPAIAKINGSIEKFISTQHILIPATAELKQTLEAAKGALTVEGSVLDERIIKDENVTFIQIKVLVREIE